MNTKLHAVTDTLGRPIRFFMTAGQVSDYTGARALVSSLPAAGWLLGDRGYDADWFREALIDRGITPCIPARKSRDKPVKYPFRDIALHCTDGQWSSAATNDATAPLVTLLRTALSGSDRDHVRSLKRLATDCHPIQPLSKGIPVCNRPRSNHLVLVINQ